MQDRRTEAIKEWMTSSPSGSSDAMTNHFKDFAESWNVSYAESTAEEVFALFRQCLEADAKQGWTEMRVTGVVKDGQFRGFGTERPFDWWPKELHGSFIQVWVGNGSHLLGKIGEDRFLVLVHRGGVADQIAKRGVPPPSR